VADQNVLDVVIVKGVIKRESDAAGIPENAIDAFADEAFEEHFGSAHEV